MNKHQFINVVGILVFIATVASIFFSMKSVDEDRAKNWIGADAVVAGVEERRGSETVGFIQVPQVILLLSYSYKFNGADYSSQSDLSFSEIDSYKKGQHIKIQLNPRDPTDTYVVRNNTGPEQSEGCSPSPSKKGAKVKAVFAIRNIPEGNIITPHDLEVREIDADKSPEDVFTSVRMATGQISRYAIPDGGQISAHDVISPIGSGQPHAK